MCPNASDIIERVSMMLIELANIYVEKSNHAHCHTEKHEWDVKAKKCEEAASDFLVFVQSLQKKERKKKRS